MMIEKRRRHSTGVRRDPIFSPWWARVEEGQPRRRYRWPRGEQEQKSGPGNVVYDREGNIGAIPPKLLLRLSDYRNK